LNLLKIVSFSRGKANKEKTQARANIYIKGKEECKKAKFFGEAPYSQFWKECKS